ncbi:HD-GYP domain-containing protein [Tumebacillus sp. ITR2]|uniref:HD-GYP domain-containing protein n=1 Tax=Tumebacillus amylolyticus TaxID=2801339 RepID=A0ABS1JAB7_9BACL|nr:HD-GYP domain-containing protein [Tumebacillus amylolyticus]MBL0387194.1 HD-GYP domain-containing protein [Tumebacillus amylolyticus]
MSFARIYKIWCLMLTLTITITGLYQAFYQDFPFFWTIECSVGVLLLLMLTLPKRFPQAGIPILFGSQMLVTLGFYAVISINQIGTTVLFFPALYTLLYPNRRYFYGGQILVSIGYLLCSWDNPLQQHVIFFSIFACYSTLLGFVSQIMVRNASEVAKFQERVEVFSHAIEARDSYTQGHSRRVSRYAVEIGKLVPGIDIELLRMAGDLHDIGKISTPDAVLLKPGRLTDEEYDVIKRHPVDGANLLRRFDVDGPILEGVLYHHERMNGTGYPEGRIGEHIPLYARILAVADTFDAMTTTRSYRIAYPPQVAYDEILSLKGLYYDPLVVDCFVKCYDTILAIFFEHQESEYLPLETAR